MGYSRFILKPCGNVYHYNANWTDPDELIKQQKYIYRTVYDSCEYIEHVWWKLVDFMANHPGCSFNQLRNGCSRWMNENTMRNLLIRTGSVGKYKYYLNKLGLSLYEKFKNVQPDPIKLMKAQAERLKQYNEAVEEGRTWPMRVENYKNAKAIEENLE